MDAISPEARLRLRIGLESPSTGSSLVSRAVRERMRVLGIAAQNQSAYLKTLENSEFELQALIEEVVVPESWFFRDEYPFRLLSEIATPWLDDPSRGPFRVLSVPCAGGEEPFTIAMTLMDRGLSADRFQIDAVDISERSLAVARRGVFTSNSFRSGDLSFRDRYFRNLADGYELSDKVRSSVRFHQGNVLDPELLRGEPPYDAVFCRNLVIYLDPPSRVCAVATLDRHLSSSGTLFLGHAEPLGILGSRFRPAAEPRSFAFVRKPESENVPQELVRSHPIAKLSKAGALARINTKRSVPAVRSVPPSISIEPRESVPRAEGLDETRLLEAAANLADIGRYEDAAKLCEDEIQRRGASPRVCYFLGVIQQARGDRDKAEAYFNKTVYLDPSHSEALLSLALFAQRRGDHAAASNFQRRAGRASGGGST